MDRGSQGSSNFALSFYNMRDRQPRPLTFDSHVILTFSFLFDQKQKYHVRLFLESKTPGYNILTSDFDPFTSYQLNKQTNKHMPFYI